MNQAHISEKKGTGLLRSLLISFAVMLLFGALSLLASSFILSGRPNPAPYIRIVGFALPALTALVGGITAGISEKKQGALCGLCSGAAFVLVLFLLSFFANGGALSAFETLISYTVLILLSVLGGLIGASQGGKRKKRRSRRR